MSDIGLRTKSGKDFYSKLEVISNAFDIEIQKLNSVETLADFETKYLGRKSDFTNLLRSLASIQDKEEKAYLGKQANTFKLFATSKIEELKVSIKNTKINDFIDITSDRLKFRKSNLHLVSTAIEEIVNIFTKLGFYIKRYPEVEWDYYAFEGLNFDKDAPARDDWETFFMEGENTKNKDPKKGRMLLTPHTSSSQVREMQRRKPPIRMMNISRVYRRQIDISHEINFFQFEALVIDKDITFMDLKGTIEHFIDNFFGKGTLIRIRPYNFPFTEPSIEIDIKVDDNAKIGKNGWLEIGGAGMVHPNVLKNGGIDPYEYTGFAFGFGVERNKLTQGALNIPDIRMIYNNDIRFLKQF